MLQILAGGQALAEELAGHPGIDLAACVGPGDRLTERLAGGGPAFFSRWTKGSLAVFASADLDVAAAAAVLAATFGGGRSEWSAQRLYGGRKNHDHLLLRIRSRRVSLTIGNPIDYDTEIGPVPGEGLLRRLEEYVASRQADGATLIFGGDCPTVTPAAGGTFWRPALLLAGRAGEARDVPGPVLEVWEAADDEEGLSLVRACEGPVTVLSADEGPARQILDAGRTVGRVERRLADRLDLTRILRRALRHLAVPSLAWRGGGAVGLVPGRLAEVDVEARGGDGDRAEHGPEDAAGPPGEQGRHP